MKVDIVETPKKCLGFKVGDIVKNHTLGKGVVVGFSSVSSEPFVFFYRRQESVCVGFDSLETAALDG